MNVCKKLIFYFGFCIALASAAFGQPSAVTGEIRADAIRLLREGRQADAAAMLEAQIAPGKNRDFRDQAIAQEWLGVTTHFFNTRDQALAEAAFGQARPLAAGLKQRKGEAEELYAFYRRVASLMEVVLYDREQAILYYDLAIRAALSGAKTSPDEVEKLRRKIARLQEEQAFLNRRKGK